LPAQVPIAQHLMEYVARLVLATHPKARGARGEAIRARGQSSPRGGQAIINGAKIIALMKGRYNVAADDIRDCARPALRHRMILNFEGEAEGIKPDDIVSKVLEHVADIPERVRRM
jgi:MoxR-like ATPase